MVEQLVIAGGQAPEREPAVAVGMRHPGQAFEGGAVERHRGVGFTRAFDDRFRDELDGAQIETFAVAAGERRREPDRTA